MMIDSTFTPCLTEEKKLVFTGVKNSVICRDIAHRDYDGNIVELWRREVGAIDPKHSVQTYVVFSGGLVVARFLKTISGLNPMDGSILWTTDIGDYGTGDMIVMVVNDAFVYVGCGFKIIALSSVNGAILWEYHFSFKDYPFVPAIVCCGSCVFFSS